MASLDQYATYSISFQGGVDPQLIDMVGPLEFREIPDTDGLGITTYYSIIADQAAIVGMIRTLHNMGIVLLSVHRSAEPVQVDLGEECHVSHVAKAI